MALTLALVQQAFIDDRHTTLERTGQHIRAAAAQGAELVCLQELHAGPYFCQHQSAELFDLAEPLDGPTAQFLGQLAAELNLVIVGSIFERRAKGLYHNTALVFDRSTELAGFYRKMHIPDDPGFYEKYYFTPGDADQPGFEPIETSVGKLGVLVCWDQWYPEAARLMALADADVLIYPTAIGWEPPEDDAEKQRQRDAWMLVQRGHAVANNLPVIAINRVGHEVDPSGVTDGIDFWGNSFVCGPQGELLLHAEHQQETVLMTEIDLQRCEQVRRIWPYLRDRRVDAYQDVTRRFRD
ncbi:apolipoprotein acyltransferase [Bacterioplanes sanyensis]|uniref:carbon-nitrogen hydrolase n=1 Tax=Bacterioplanes sanyensis TaxID=1249553 RepID=UPI00167AAA4A|nr:carbon-nitrogen hydrolase [Bacterioplanes sanyensis]GGY54092.1 apolipoprotein acyltransferase [Bacterioplanes sanyensis]